jgi:hypothetical protein
LRGFSERHKTKHRIKTKDYKYKNNININLKPKIIAKHLLANRLFKTNKMDIKIIYSLFSDSIKKQLKEAGLKFDKEEVKIIQELSFANMNLKFHEIISETQAEKNHKAIHERLVKHIDLHNG